jgi:hypothetical protein
MACRSISAIVEPGMRTAPERGDERAVGKSPGPISAPSQSTTARSTAFSSSRTLPGQAYSAMRASASRVKPRTALPFSPA